VKVETSKDNTKYQSRWLLILKQTIKSFLFLIIGCLIFIVAQRIVVPKRFVYIKSYDAGKLAGYYLERPDSIDAIICGTSHSSKAILPMELYETYGIKAFNLSTSRQPIEVTYFVISEALRTQKPKVVIYDVSRLYGDDYDYAMFVVDEMKAGKNKVALSRKYLDKTQSDMSVADLLLPFFRYHTRWKELSEEDFTYALRDNLYYGKGGQIVSNVLSSDASLEQMNLEAAKLIQNTEKVRCIYKEGIYEEERQEQVLYSTKVPDENLEWFLKIKELCEINDIQLLAVKVPSIYMPQIYGSAWTEEKYHTVRALCDTYGIAYYDLQYDTDINIDWDFDSSDGGQHLNINGAQKASFHLGKYLKEHYKLSDIRSEQWDKDLMSYQKARDVAKLEAEQDFISYIKLIANKYQNKVILISVAGDMAAGLTQEDIAALRLLGLQTDFSNAYQYSYAAVIENGKVRYEELSNRDLEYSGQIDKSGKNYTIYSSGYNTRPSANIRIDDNQIAVDNIGMNIVVYDAERSLVIDSVCFNTSLREHTVSRNDSKIAGFLEAFERYIAEKEE